MFDEAISYDKVNAWAYLERGKVYLAKGKTSRAEAGLQKASSLGHQGCFLPRRFKPMTFGFELLTSLRE